MTRVAILGVTGYIGRSLLNEFFLEKDRFMVSLFSRSVSKVEDLISTMPHAHTYECKNLNDFSQGSYDVIINCTGIGDPSVLKKNPSSIFAITEEMDALILSYITKHQETLYINISSGAVYGSNTKDPITSSTPTVVSFVEMTPYDYYAVAKINSEAKHRAMNNVHIVDLRVFAFFSSFVDQDSGFFMSEVARAILHKKVLVTTDQDMVRDYSCPKDLFSLISLVIKKKTVNDFFDVYSKAPVTKFEILDFCKKVYGLEYSIQKSEVATGITKSYYSTNTKALGLGYSPAFTSLEGIQTEMEKMLNKK